MPQLATPGIVCAVREHGEHGAVVRLLTPDHGLVAGYVRGGRSRRLRPVLMPGNEVAAEFRARTAEQLAGLTVELGASRAPWHSEPLPAAAIAHVTALTAATLPEEHGYPRLFEALSALLDAICHAPSARGWAPALAAYEALLLRELGYGAPSTTGEPLAALRRTGAALESHLFAGRRSEPLAARADLIERLARALG